LSIVVSIAVHGFPRSTLFGVPLLHIPPHGFFLHLDAPLALGPLRFSLLSSFSDLFPELQLREYPKHR
jgi:hypothetical protein